MGDRFNDRLERLARGKDLSEVGQVQRSIARTLRALEQEDQGGVAGYNDRHCRQQGPVQRGIEMR
jgi:hypothetical protein